MKYLNSSKWTVHGKKKDFWANLIKCILNHIKCINKRDGKWLQIYDIMSIQRRLHWHHFILFWNSFLYESPSHTKPTILASRIINVEKNKIKVNNLKLKRYFLIWTTSFVFIIGLCSIKHKSTYKISKTEKWTIRILNWTKFAIGWLKMWEKSKSKIQCGLSEKKFT